MTDHVMLRAVIVNGNGILSLVRMLEGPDKEGTVNVERRVLGGGEGEAEAEAGVECTS
jgi:hypothetical protein